MGEVVTLGQAIEKVGVGGRVSQGNAKPETVLYVGALCALLISSERDCEWAAVLDKEGWSPVLPKKRVVLQAWRNMTTGFTVFLGEGETFNSKHGYVRRQDIPDMITEDGKWVFE